MGWTPKHSHGKSQKMQSAGRRSMGGHKMAFGQRAIGLLTCRAFSFIRYGPKPGMLTPPDRMDVHFAIRREQCQDVAKMQGPCTDDMI